MLYDLIQCRSLTHAQKISAALDKGRIPNRTIRSPRALAGRGCSHSVRVAQRHLPQALELLAESGLEVNRIFVTAGDDHYEEVEF